MVKKAQGDPTAEISPVEASASEASAPEASTPKQSAKKPDKVRIIIRSDKSIGGSDAVKVSDGSGRQVLIKRDVEVVVSRGVMETLNDAVEVVYETNDSGQVVGERKNHRFNFTVLGQA